MNQIAGADSPPSQSTLEAGLFRRLGSMMYDTMLLFGVLFVAAIPISFIDPLSRELGPIEWTIRAYFVAVIAAYFAWFWSHGGQTLGMRAWKLHIVDSNHQSLSFGLGLKRFFVALVCLLPIGAGLIWILFRKDKNALHDLISNTYIEFRKPK